MIPGGCGRIKDPAKRAKCQANKQQVKLDYYAARGWDTSSSTSPTATPAGKTAYLTFDDGPDYYGNTVEIAAVLATKGIRATFFINGVLADGTVKYNLTCENVTIDGQRYGINFGDPRFRNINPTAYQLQVVSQFGHAIGVHGWQHEPWNSASFTSEAQLDLLVQGLVSIGVQPARLLRAPQGAWPDQIPINGYEDWYYYGWTVDSCDNLATGKCKAVSQAEDLVENVATQLEEQGLPDAPIILLHSFPNAFAWKAIVNPDNDRQDLIKRLNDLGYSVFNSLPRSGDEPGRLIPN
jgi:peptidoglycan/xylan/chitin deacetylase (PgdA/CDA1 family)